MLTIGLCVIGSTTFAPLAIGFTVMAGLPLGGVVAAMVFMIQKPDDE